MGKPVVCYRYGTNIRTLTGEVPVQDLQVGDQLVTHCGKVVPLRWLGWRSLDATSYGAEPQTIQPICIRANALADGAPYADLYVSPQHALFLDGRLIAANLLDNAATVTQARFDKVTYYHVECDEHVLLFANGAVSESYLENADRSFFANSGSTTALRPALPNSASVSPLPQADIEDVLRIRAILYHRAIALGYPDVANPDVRSRLRLRQVA